MRSALPRQRLHRAFVYLLCAALFLSAAVLNTSADDTAGLDNFRKKNSFSADTFTDIRTSDWFYGDVKAVYEAGLMVGSSATTFNPGGNVTLAETVVLAARLHSIYHTGKNDFQLGSPWYQAYVDYALQNRILTGPLTDYGRAATRSEYAQILSAAFPDEALAVKNRIADNAIPDVKLSAAYGPAVYRLYRAGILVGNDAQGTFAPGSNIRRSEVAAIIARMAYPAQRVSKTLEGTSGTTTPGVTPPPASAAPSFVIGTVNAKQGAKDVAVTVAVKNNPGLASIAMLVSYDTGLTLKKIEYNDKLGGESMLPPAMRNPTKLLWLSPFANVNGDWVLATLYFDVAANASVGLHQIAATYDPDDVYGVDMQNIHFDVTQGAIRVTK